MIEGAGTQVAFVHMGSEDEGAAFLAGGGMPGALHVSDPSGELYAAFGLVRGNIRQVFLSPRVWWGGFRSIFLQGHRVSWPGRDPLRMPGVFLVRNGRIERAFRHRTTADRPDYLALAGLGDRRSLPPAQDSARAGGQRQRPPAPPKA